MPVTGYFFPYTITIDPWLLNRPVCKQVVSSAASLYQLKTRSTGNSNGCLHGGLVQLSSETLCQSTMESSGQSPISDTQPGGTGISFSSASMEGPTLVSTVASDGGQRTTSHSSITGNNSISMSQRPSRHFTSVSRVGCIRDRCQSSHLSESATDLILSSWRVKSSKLYNSSFNKWARWCEERDRNPISGPISNVANFLAELFQEGYQYSSMFTVHRS